MNEQSKLIAKAIDEWFNIHANEITDRNFWDRNPVAKVIKAELTKRDHWKNRKRGKPNKTAADLIPANQAKEEKKNELPPIVEDDLI